MNDMSVLRDVAREHGIASRKEIARFSRSIDPDVVAQVTDAAPLFIELTGQSEFDFTPFGGASIPSVIGLSIQPKATSFSTTAFQMLAQALPNLAFLALPGLSAKQAGQIDLSHFTQLRRLRLGKQKPGITPWTGAKQIRSCVIDGFAEPDLSSFADMRDLVALELMPARNLTALTGIEGLKSLKFLHIHQAPKLTDISALGQCPGVESVLLEKTKALGPQDDVFLTLPHLKCLHVDQVNGYRRYLNAPDLKKLHFDKDIALKSQMAFYDDFEFLDRINDEGEPQRMFWDAYSGEVFG